MEVDFEVNDIDNSKQIEAIRGKLNMIEDKKHQSGITETENASDNKIIDIDIGLLVDNPYQPRLSYNEDSIFELAMSIKENTLLQPIVITKGEGDKFIIVCGHRRVRACKKIRKKTISAILTKGNSSSIIRTKALIENLQRDNMPSIDTALSFEAAIRNKDFKHQSDLATAIGKDKSYVSKMIKLLTLPEKVLKDLIANKSINDKQVLDSIRRIKSQKDCEDIYFWYIDKKPSRAELKEKIDSLYKKDNFTSVKISTNTKGHTIKIPKLTEDKVQLIEDFIMKTIQQ